MFLKEKSEIRLSGSSKSVLWFLTIQAVLASSFYTVLTSKFGNEANVVVSLVWLLIGCVFALKYNGLRLSSSKYYFLLLVVISCANILISDDKGQSLMRWVGLFALVCVVDWVSTRGIDEFIHLWNKWVPWMLIVLIVPDIVNLHFNPPDSGRMASHVTSIYANLLFVFAIINFPQLKSLIWLSISILAIYLSGSRGALVGFGISFAIFSIMLFYMRKYIFACILTLSAIFMFLRYETMVSIFAETRLAEGVNALESILKSGEERVALANLVWEKVMESPFLGHGFQKIGFIVGNDLLECHTGHITLVLYIGIPFACIVYCYFVVGFFKVVFSRILNRNQKVFYMMFFFAFNLRAISEPLTLFDLGNLFTFYFLVVHFAFVYNSSRVFNRSFTGDPIYLNS